MFNLVFVAAGRSSREFLAHLWLSFSAEGQASFPPKVASFSRTSGRVSQPRKGEFPALAASFSRALLSPSPKDLKFIASPPYVLHGAQGEYPEGRAALSRRVVLARTLPWSSG